ncbi:MAG: tetratricopeptide repeat protein [Planctomycetota bacterium]
MPVPTDPALRRKRLLIIASVVIVIAAGSVALYGFQTHRQNLQLADAKTQALDAFRAGDYQRVEEILTDKIDRFQDDPNTLFTYAQARRLGPNPDVDDQRAWITSVERVLTLQPDHAQAGRAILPLYIGRDRGPDHRRALTLTERLLKQTPDDPEILKHRADALRLLKRFDEAYETAQRLLEIDPNAFNHYRLALDLMQQRGAQPADLVAQAKAWQAQYPDNPLPTLALTLAHRVDRDLPNALATLETVANGPQTDFELIRTVANFYDLLGQHTAAVNHLIQHLPDDATDAQRAAVAARLFNAERYRDVLSILQPIDRSNAEPLLLAWHATANLKMGNRDAALRDLADLQAFQTNDFAKSYYEVLSAELAQPADLPRLLEAAERAATRFSERPEFHHWLALAYTRAGNTPAALYQTEVAIKSNNRWAEPYGLRAQLLLNQGNPEEAARSASAAYQLTGNVRYGLLLSRAQTQLITPQDNPATDRLLSQLDTLITALPDASAPLLLKLETLARANRTNQANAFIQTLLARQPTLPDTVLAGLSRLAQDYQLAAAPSINAKLLDPQRTSPEAAVLQAQQAFDAGQPDRGLEVLEDARRAATAAGNLQDRLQLDAVYAGYLESLGQDQAAAAAWIGFADAAPNQAQPTRLALQSAAVRADRPATDRLIKRLQKLAGDTQPDWRIARARFLLTSADPVAAAPQAIDVLTPATRDHPSNPMPFLLLAEAHHALGDTEQSIAALRQGLAVDNDAARTGRTQIRLAKLLLDQRAFRAATQQINDALRNRELPRDLRAQAARMLVLLGEFQRPRDILQQLNQEQPLAREQLLWLITLYSQLNEHDRADRLLIALLADNPSPEAIVIAATAYNRAGQPSRAAAALDQLKGTDLPLDEQHAAWANHHAQLGQADQAIDRYRSAVQSNPSQRDHHADLARYLLLVGRVDPAITAARDAIQTLGAAPAFQLLIDHADLLRAQRDNAELRTLAASALKSPQFAGSSRQALQTVQRHATNTANGDPTRLADELATLARQEPANAALGTFAAAVRYRVGLFKLAQPDDASRAQGQNLVEEAADAASNLMYSFPGEAAAARIATRAYATVRDWSKSLSAATIWSNRAPHQAPAADLAIARAQRSRGNPAAALRTLRRYRPAIEAGDPRVIEFAAEYALALIQSRATPNARSLLLPHLSQPAYRAVWLRLASDRSFPAATAQDWLDTVAEHVDPVDSREQYQLAYGYWFTANRAFSQPLLDKARKHANFATAVPNANALAWALRGEIALASQDFADAETAYRNALESQDSPGLRNNLAMALISQDRQLEEAIALSRQAVDATPNSANFLDTLAQAHAAAGQLPQAIEAMQRATELAPTEPIYLRRLADYLEKAGENDRAGEVRDKLTAFDRP